jgi:hypothetical protein
MEELNKSNEAQQPKDYNESQPEVFSKLDELKNILSSGEEPEIITNPDGSLSAKDNYSLLYIGTKIVRASEMTSIDFKMSKGIPCENEENALGYLVIYEDGYRSWSPKEVFERCYRMISPKEMKIIHDK